MEKITQEDADRDWKEVNEQEVILIEIIANLEKLASYGDVPHDALKVDLLRYRVYLDRARDTKAGISRYCEKFDLKQP